MQWKWFFRRVCIFESFSFTAEWAAKLEPFTHNMGHYMLQGAKATFTQLFSNSVKQYWQEIQQQLKMECLAGEPPTANETPAMEQTTPAHIAKLLSTQFLDSNYWSSSNHLSAKMDSVLSYCLTAFSVSRMSDLWSWEDNLLNCSQSFEMQSKDRYIFDLSLLTSHSDYLIIHYSLALLQCQVLICFILYSSYLSFSLQSYYSDIFKWK